MSLEKYEDAFILYRRVLQRRADWTEAQEYFGDAAVRAQHFEEAIKAYLNVTRLQPEQAETFAKLGVVCGKLRRYKQAAEALKRAVELEPDDAIAHFNLGNAVNDTGPMGDVLRRCHLQTNLKCRLQTE